MINPITGYRATLVGKYWRAIIEAGNCHEVHFYKSKDTLYALGFVDE